MLALWALIAAILALAAAIVHAAWTYVQHQPLEALTEEEIAVRLAPIAAELLIWDAERHPDTPEEERER